MSKKQKSALSEQELAKLKAEGKISLTDKRVAGLRPAPSGKRYVIWDGIQPNFCLRVSDKGRKSFIAVRRRAGEPQPTWHVLGAYPALSLGDARDAASEALKLLSKGKTPKEVEEERRRAEARKRADTVASVAEEFIKRYIRENKLRSAGAAEALIHRELLGEKREGDKWIPDQAHTLHWRARPLTSIARRDVVELVETVVDRGGQSQGRKVLAAVRKMFNWAIHRDKYGLELSPCYGIKATDLVGKPRHRSRVLDDTELFLVWRATKKMDYPFGALVRTLLLTGQRLNEIAKARWPEIDPAHSVLTVPAERMKAKPGHEHAHSVPLTPRVVTILASLPRFAAARKGQDDFLFTTTGGKRPVSGFSKAKRRLDREIERARLTLLRLARRRGNKLQIAEVPPFTLHDLRRTCRTRLSELKVLPVVAELVLAHKQQGIHKTYDVHTYDAEKRDALERWERLLLGIVEPSPTPNVVRMHKRSGR